MPVFQSFLGPNPSNPELSVELPPIWQPDVAPLDLVISVAAAREATESGDGPYIEWLSSPAWALPFDVPQLVVTSGVAADGRSAWWRFVAPDLVGVIRPKAVKYVAPGGSVVSVASLAHLPPPPVRVCEYVPPDDREFWFPLSLTIQSTMFGAYTYAYQCMVSGDYSSGIPRLKAAVAA